MTAESLVVIKGLLFFSVLLVAAIHDAKTRIIPDTIHILLILISLIGFDWNSLLGFFLVPIPFLSVALKESESLGGGDVKLMAGIGCVLGVMEGFSAGAIGLSLFILINLIRGKRNQPFALGPYLAVGAMVVFLVAPK
ncbi:prepilin peptidase [Desulfosporosinus nitroreducens]|uniref:Prepilin peptidase n=1 Tax=Desulfosporosinus nitroreducens TaxID=2018668 RepID=A0ABT8QRU1_9FIRM|nr:prepilin peptidase [Desulfosporosinus nitroreducens]MDO0824068.1 prepilin peptidase [Desulfosporosinus nitroreducens]